MRRPHIPGRSTLDRRLATQRLPVHESMTAATLGKSDLLRLRFKQSLQLQASKRPQHMKHATRGGGVDESPEAGAGGVGQFEGGPAAGQLGAWESAGGMGDGGGVQVVAVTLCGAVISKAHAKAGSYVAPEEREEAARLVLGEMLLALDTCCSACRGGCFDAGGAWTGKLAALLRLQ